MEVDGEELPVAAVGEGAFRGADVAIFCAPPEVARAWAPKARAEGCRVIDASMAFREDEHVPLVVPALNGAALDAGASLVALPAGAVAAVATALAPLHAAAAVERVAVTTLEPVASAGRAAVDQLEREVADLMNGREPETGAALPHRLAFNVVPQVGTFGPDGRTAAEGALPGELRRVLGAPGLAASATAVRVPVFYGLTAVIGVTLARPLAPDEARTLLRAAPGVKVLDAPGDGIYPMPMLTVNDDAVLVGRVRADPSHPRGLELVLVTDELRQGVAVNAVRVAERLSELPALVRA
ncbi:MAG: aspartate-semialdehyde dehydrogenase [Anaeromyxobacter sp.]